MSDVTQLIKIIINHEYCMNMVSFTPTSSSVTGLQCVRNLANLTISFHISIIHRISLTKRIPIRSLFPLHMILSKRIKKFRNLRCRSSKHVYQNEISSQQTTLHIYQKIYLNTYDATKLINV